MYYVLYCDAYYGLVDAGGAMFVGELCGFPVESILLLTSAPDTCLSQTLMTLTLVTLMDCYLEQSMVVILTVSMVEFSGRRVTSCTVVATVLYSASSTLY